MRPEGVVRHLTPPWFARGQQQDSDEQLKYMLDVLEEEDKNGRKLKEREKQREKAKEETVKPAHGEGARGGPDTRGRSDALANGRLDGMSEVIDIDAAFDDVDTELRNEAKCTDAVILAVSSGRGREDAVVTDREGHSEERPSKCAQHTPTQAEYSAAPGGEGGWVRVSGGACKGEAREVEPGAAQQQQAWGHADEAAMGDMVQETKGQETSTEPQPPSSCDDDEDGYVVVGSGVGSGAGSSLVQSGRTSDDDMVMVVVPNKAGATSSSTLALSMELDSDTGLDSGLDVDNSDIMDLDFNSDASSKGSQSAHQHQNGLVDAERGTASIAAIVAFPSLRPQLIADSGDSSGLKDGMSPHQPQVGRQLELPRSPLPAYTLLRPQSARDSEDSSGPKDGISQMGPTGGAGAAPWDVFHGKIAQDILCRACGGIVTKVEAFTDIALSFQHHHHHHDDVLLPSSQPQQQQQQRPPSQQGQPELDRQRHGQQGLERQQSPVLSSEESQHEQKQQISEQQQFTLLTSTEVLGVQQQKKEIPAQQQGPGTVQTRPSGRSTANGSTMTVANSKSSDGGGGWRLQSMLNHFLGVEVLAGADQYMCEGCGGKRDAEKRTRVVEAPQTMVLVLKRFTYDAKTGRVEKICDPVPLDGEVYVESKYFGYFSLSFSFVCVYLYLCVPMCVDEMWRRERGR